MKFNFFSKSLLLLLTFAGCTSTLIRKADASHSSLSWFHHLDEWTYVGTVSGNTEAAIVRVREINADHRYSDQYFVIWAVNYLNPRVTQEYEIHQEMYRCGNSFASSSIDPSFYDAIAREGYTMTSISYPNEESYEYSHDGHILHVVYHRGWRPIPDSPTRRLIYNHVCR